MKRKLYGIVVAAVYILFGVYFYHDPMILKNTSLTVEMGSHFDPYDNIQNIVFGTKKDVDIKGEVDLKKPGDYVITYVFKDKTKSVNVAVRDTQGPHLEVVDKKFDLNTKIRPECFVTKVSDASEFEVSFDKKPDLDRVGEQKLKIVAEDIYGNSTEKDVVLNRIQDKKPPVFPKIDKLKVMQGTSEDISSQIKVKDDLDPEPKVKIDTSSLDIFTPGLYTITAKASDRSGND